MLKFYILRLLAFLIPFIIYVLLGLGWLASAIFATITGICLSYLFLNKQRREAAQSISEKVSKIGNTSKTIGELEDNDYEDAALDAQEEKSSTSSIQDKIVNYKNTTSHNNDENLEPKNHLDTQAIDDENTTIKENNTNKAYDAHKQQENLGKDGGVDNKSESKSNAKK